MPGESRRLDGSSERRHAATRVAVISPVAVALLVILAMLVFVGVPLVLRRTPLESLWNISMLSTGAARWYGNLWLLWFLLAIAPGGIYVYFW